MNFGLVPCETYQVLSRSKTYLPFIQTNRRQTYVFMYLKVFSTCGTYWKKWVIAISFWTITCICGETKKTKSKIFWYFWAKLLRFCFVNQFFQTRTSEFYTYRISSISYPIRFHLQSTRTKRRRSDPVLWQKPLHQQKCQKGKVTTQTTPQQSSIKQQ